MYRCNAARISKLLAAMILIAALFPYSPPILSSSTQPWAILLIILFSLLNIFFLFLKKERVYISKLSLFLLLIICVFGTSKSWMADNLLVFGIHIFKYCCAFIFIWFGCLWLPRNTSNILFLAIIVWVVAASIQLFNPLFLSFIVSGQGLSVGRGVASFAPEPSFFSMHFCLIYLILYREWKFQKITKNKYALGVLVIISGLLLSASGTSIIAIAFISSLLFFDNRLIKSKNLRLITFPAALSIAIIIFLGMLNSESRMGEILQNTINGSITTDASIMTRSYYILIGVMSIMEGHILGFAFFDFEDKGLSIFNSVPNIIYDASKLVDPNGNGRIHSLFAQLALDFGVSVVFLIISVIFLFFKSLNKILNFSLSEKIIYLLFFLYLSLLPVPIGSPLYFMVVGILIFKHKNLRIRCE